MSSPPVPSAAAVAAGRWDLHQAITSHGGYRAVAAELERRPYKGLPDELLTTKVSLGLHVYLPVVLNP